MNAIWHGIATGFEWVFAAVKPMGPYANAFFIIVGFVGVAYWLWYGESTRKGGKNYLADNADKK
jgi:hypothetical protein